MKNAIYIILTIAAAAVAAWRMWHYVNTPIREQQLTDLVVAVVCILIAIVFGGLFLAGRVNKEEEIHITK